MKVTIELPEGTKLVVCTCVYTGDGYTSVTTKTFDSEDLERMENVDSDV